MQYSNHFKHIENILQTQEELQRKQLATRTVRKPLLRSEDKSFSNTQGLKLNAGD